MDTTHIETVIIGAGQAGLATGYHLRRRGRPFVILDANARIGDNWRRQWDSLKLYSPAKYDSLPGMAFPAKRWAFPGKDDVGDYLETYARTFELPVRLETRVLALDRDGDRFRVRTDRGTWTCDNVVVATGTFGRTPNVPAIAGQLSPSILQLHSSEYRRPGQLRDGPVLVVGASHSGCDIAFEVAASRPTILAGRDCGEIPPRLEAPVMHLIFPMLLFAWKHVVTRRTPIGRKEMDEIRHHGGPMLRVKRADLTERGVERVTSRIEEVRDGLPVVAGEPREVANVVWATGFRQTFDWIHLPVFDEGGWPREMRGVVSEAEGLFFCGLSFQYAFSSMLLSGAGRDAALVVDRIVSRMKRAARLSPAS
ncbi:putative flavoprotein involved in K+ transport [Nocardioides luteus]|uniref:Oxidoreductase n=1 Tax=Nocardioides luteus TaxID=1844 RepID=A0ABQ5SZW4_9ACTN|nr:NAD(P)/FAD-dependent oxidoreductase [Nocardioides luteus]MDR7310488.1 putative flavoprotein involved in K+ transport [Nocardioides luteus]GGR73743.1 oxidoreductase [Nocardioides luteus]GLJ69730.1 oxidoreductase [Nocardioides luteus]